MIVSGHLCGNTYAHLLVPSPSAVWQLLWSISNVHPRSLEVVYKNFTSCTKRQVGVRCVFSVFEKTETALSVTRLRCLAFSVLLNS